MQPWIAVALCLLAATGCAPDVGTETYPNLEIRRDAEPLTKRFPVIGAPGPFLTGVALDDTLSTTGWTNAAYLDRAHHQLVISAMDD